MTKQSQAKIFGGVFLLIGLFLLNNIANAAICGETFNGFDTKAWGDGFCWAKVYKIEVATPPSTTCPTSATDTDGNNYTPLIIPTLDTAGKSSSFCMIGPIKRTKNLVSGIKENNGSVYYSFKSATGGESNYDTLSNGKIKGVCPEGWYLPLAKDVEGALMSASQDSDLDAGAGPKDCWKLNDFMGTLACTHGLGAYSGLKLPVGYYQEGSRWWGLGDREEGTERTMWTTTIKGKDIVYYFNKPQGEMKGNLSYREMTNGTTASWNLSGDYLYHPVYCIKELSASAGTPRGTEKIWYQDADSDGFGNPSESKTQNNQPSGYIANKTDCNDNDATINPGQTEICNNSKDDNCNGEIDESCSSDMTGTTSWYRDTDADGYGNPAVIFQDINQPVGYVGNKNDCNDLEATMNPGLSETCGDSKDNDCNGKTDENCSAEKLWYRDVDGDGYGNPKLSKMSIAKPAGYADKGADCNDSNKAVSPKAKELCDRNLIDENCNGQKNEGCVACYPDRDKDGYGIKNWVAEYYAGACPKAYATNKTDCNDNLNSINPGAKENCYNRKDDNCDGKGDNGRGTCY